MKYILAIFALIAAGSVFAQTPGSKLYIQPSAPEKTLEDGTKIVTTTGSTFGHALQAELLKNKAPFILTTDREQADYVVLWSVNEYTSRVGYVSDTATVSLEDKKHQIIWSGVASKKGEVSCANAIAKQLAEAMKHKK